MDIALKNAAVLFLFADSKIARDKSSVFTSAMGSITTALNFSGNLTIAAWYQKIAATNPNAALARFAYEEGDISVILFRQIG
jgi:hypothetical protein